jgi:hypothetical protein
MSEPAQDPGSTIAGGAIPAVHPPAGTHAPAPSWIAAMLQQPTATISLIGVLLLGGVQGADALQGRNISTEDLETEIAKREIAATQAQTLEQAARNSAECTEAVKALDQRVQDLAKTVGERGDEQLAFTGEIAQYLPRAMEKLTKDPPDTGPRFDEYVRKSLLRDFRQVGTP